MAAKMLEISGIGNVYRYFIRITQYEHINDFSRM
jgi:hypothetical protein